MNSTGDGIHETIEESTEYYIINYVYSEVKVDELDLYVFINAFEQQDSNFKVSLNTLDAFIDLTANPN